MLQDVWRSLMCEPAETCMLYQRQVDNRHSSSCIYVHVMQLQGVPGPVGKLRIARYMRLRAPGSRACRCHG